jgi:mannose-6-phosphate isomerase-like protein (cupin superfamily)
VRSEATIPALDTEGTPMGNDVNVVRGTDAHTTKLEGGAWYQLLNGADHGFGDVSIIVTEDAANATSGADQTHRHPHISTLVITEGRGRFTIDDVTVEAVAGDVVVVPAHAWHSYANAGDGALRVVGVHDSDHLEAEVAT